MEAVQGLRKARFEREMWTYFALLCLHNGRGSYLDFEPLGVLCLVTSARSKGMMLKENNTLKELSLWNCGLQLEGIEEVIKGVQVNTNLKTLDLSDNTIDNKRASSLGKNDIILQ
eukprot:Em0002g780a